MEDDTQPNEPVSTTDEPRPPGGWEPWSRVPTPPDDSAARPPAPWPPPVRSGVSDPAPSHSVEEDDVLSEPIGATPPPDRTQIYTAPREDPWVGRAPPPPASSGGPATIMPGSGSESQSATPAPTSPPTLMPPETKRGAVQVRRLRRGRLVIRKIDPWAVLKFSLVFYLCMLVISLLAVGVIFATLKAFGVIHNIEKFLSGLGEDNVSITGGWLFRWVFLIGLVGSVIASVVTMFMAFLYNLIADVVGGIEMIVTERD